MIKYNCQEFHNSCISCWILKFNQLSISTIKLYGLVNILSSISSKLNFNTNNKFDKGNITTIIKYYLKKPTNLVYASMLNEIKSIIYKTLKSSLFLGGLLLILRITCCLSSRLTGTYSIYCAFIQTFLCSIPIILEPSNRAKDLASFVISRGLSDFGKILVETNIIRPIPNIINIIFSLSVILSYICDNQTTESNNILYLKKQIKIILNFLLE